MHALHHDHRFGTIIPEHLGHEQQIRIGKIAPQLTCIGRLAHQVKLVTQIFVKFSHHLAWLQATPIDPQALDPTSDDVHQRDIFPNRSMHTGTQNFDCHVGAVFECRKMHLRDRRRGHWLAIKMRKQGIRMLAERLRDLRNRQRAGKWRHPVLQMREFVGNIGRQ